MKRIQDWALRLDLNRLWLIFAAIFTLHYGAFVHPVSDLRPASILLTLFHLLLATTMGFISSYILRSIGYFETLRETPRKNEFLLLLFSVALAEFLIAVGFSAMIDRLELGIMPLIALPLPTFAVAFPICYVLLTRGSLWQRKRRIGLRLQPEEAEQFLQSLKYARAFEQVEIIPYAQALEELSRERHPNIDLIVFSRAGSRNMLGNRFLLRAHVAGIEVMDRRDATAMLTKRINIDDIDTWSFMASAKKQTAPERFARNLQLMIEPIIALALMVAFFPVFLVVALLIKSTSPGPVLYGQRRTGHLGRVFVLYKFRSMRTDSEANGYQWASKKDPRVTPVGRFLRKSRLDELPQLWNIVRGEMNFIGPRPERPEIYADLSAKIPLFSMRTDVRPGITGLAQVWAGYAASVEQSRVKLEHDLYYIQQMSFWLDLLIILKTFRVVLLGNEFIPSEPHQGYREEPEEEITRREPA